MALSRYNFSIKTKIKATGRLHDKPYFTGYFGSDEDALAARTALENLLANNAKVSCSKVLYEAGNPEIDDLYVNAEDYKDLKILANYVNPGAGVYAQKKSELHTLFLPGVDKDTTDDAVTDFIELLSTKTLDQVVEVHFNNVIGITPTYKNVREGAPAEEPVLMP